MCSCHYHHIIACTLWDIGEDDAMTVTYHHALEPGTRIDSYEINNVLGVGGFGVTYRALDHTLQCQVAIKEYLPMEIAVRMAGGTTVGPKSDNDVENYEYGLKRFLDEARTLARFHEPNIVRVIRFLEAHDTAYFIMDYEDGQPLSERLKKAVTLGEDEILTTIVPILRSLRAVHAQQFLHRDIKPDNIYLRKDGSPVLLDFGSARQALSKQSRAMTGMVTPGYAPFEQYLTKGKQGAATDLYAIGATMYHCVTGEAPVTSTERVAAIQDGESDPIGNLGAHVEKDYSTSFLRAMMWMLETDAKHRPQTVNEALAALSHGGDDRATSTVIRPGEQARSTTAATEVITEVILDERLLKAAEDSLSVYVGPLAKILVKRAAHQTSDLDEFCQILAKELPDKQRQSAFCTALRRKALS